MIYFVQTWKLGVVDTSVMQRTKRQAFRLYDLMIQQDYTTAILRVKRGKSWMMKKQNGKIVRRKCWKNEGNSVHFSRHCEHR